MHKIFGTKYKVSYVDRKGAYVIPPTMASPRGCPPKGFFFLGGGSDENETDFELFKESVRKKLAALPLSKTLYVLPKYMRNIL